MIDPDIIMQIRATTISSRLQMLYKIMHQNIAIVLMYIHCRSQMVRVSHHRRDRTMSVLLMTIVMVFIICNTARVTCNLFEAIQVDKLRRKKLMIQRLYCNGNKLDREVFKKCGKIFHKLLGGFGLFLSTVHTFWPFFGYFDQKIIQYFPYFRGGGKCGKFPHFLFFEGFPYRTVVNFLLKFLRKCSKTQSQRLTLVENKDYSKRIWH